MPHATHDPAQPRCRRAHGFTMIELLVVIGIIAVLISLLVIVGARVAGTGKQSATLSTIKTLDTALAALIQERGRLPRAVVRDPRSSGSSDDYWPIADGAWGDEKVAEEQINSAGWFLQLASETGAADLSGLDPELLRPYSPTAAGSISGTPDTTQPMLTTPIDGWGNRIRFVHPDFDGNMRDVDPDDVLGPAPDGGRYVGGVQVTRIGAVSSDTELDRLNADGGFAPGNHPYFYSLGPDGKAGAQVNAIGEALEDFNRDNIYATTPEFDRQTP